MRFSVNIAKDTRHPHTFVVEHILGHSNPNRLVP